MYKVLINVFGVKVQLLTTVSEFASFVRKNYSCFVQEEIKSPDILVTFSASAGQNIEIEKDRLKYIEGGVYLGNQKIYWENEFGFRVLLECSNNDKFRLESFHNALLSKTSSESEKYENFQRSMRWIIHFPVFVLLRLKQGKAVLHASAVEKDGHAIVFCGFNKVGKSTLAMYLTKMKGYKFMTENFLLFDSDKFYGFPERIRMDIASIKALNIQDYDIKKIYGKHHIDLKRGDMCLSAKPHLFFIVTKGHDFGISKLSAYNTELMVNSLHSYLQEFPENSYFAFLPFIGIYCRKGFNGINHILNKTNCFCLTHSNDWELSRVAEEVEKCI